MDVLPSAAALDDAGKTGDFSDVLVLCTAVLATLFCTGLSVETMPTLGLILARLAGLTVAAFLSCEQVVFWAFVLLHAELLVLADVEC